MRKLSIITILVVLSTMFSTISYSESYTCNGFEYELLDDGTALLGLYVGEEGADVVIPDELDGHPVTGVSDNPFWQTPVASITVAENHPYFMIIDGALYGKTDGKLIYYPPHAPASVLKLPKGIVEFGKHALYHCTNILGIVFDE